ncbi:pentatricopeptide repeat-containing protein At5g39710-like [Lotus japonicus]|uniref:pentatricopeptide repeat-containing protein At5g39710-like n=1 Tax=Lotus japonicus TaxID=34305 RepID=UPI002586F42D|nr:pentatricopeptide repeat-containing protein At5g39710-like [Lotus japonicus]
MVDKALEILRGRSEKGVERKRVWRYDEGYKILRDKVGVGFSPTFATYKLLILAYCNVGMVDKALVILRRMLEKGVDPDCLSFKEILQGCFRDFEGYGTEGCEPDFLSFMAVLQGLCKDKWKTKAEELLKEMNGKGLPIDDTLEWMLKRIHQDFIEEKQQEGEEIHFRAKNSLKQDKIRSSQSSREDLAQARCSKHKTTEVEKVLEGMNQDGLAPNEKTCKSLIELFGDQLRYEEGYKILRDRVGAGFSPSFATYNMIVLAYCNVRMVDKSLEILRAMV